MRRTRSTVTAAAALAVAAVTAVWAGATLAATDPAEGPREFDVRERAGGERETNATPEARPTSDPTRPARSVEPPTAALPPRSLSIPALGVSPSVVPTGVTRAGNAQIPRDGDLVGWYEYGSAPGDVRGNAVLIGHRDTEAEGPGALYDLDSLQPGDTLTVRSGARTYRYEVAALRSIEKAGLPDSLFRRGGPHQLVVITCGGAYLPEAGGYQENLFAVAVPVGR